MTAESIAAVGNSSVEADQPMTSSTPAPESQSTLQSPSITEAGPAIAAKTARLPGRNLVALLFLFGTLATGFLWIYSYFQLAPFKELQQAIAAEYPGAYPRVEGGRHKKSSPTLRIVLTFNRRLLEGDSSNEIFNRILQLTREHQKLDGFELVEIYLVSRIAERVDSRLERKLRVSDLIAMPAG